MGRWGDGEKGRRGELSNGVPLLLLPSPILWFVDHEDDYGDDVVVFVGKV